MTASRLDQIQALTAIMHRHSENEEAISTHRRWLIRAALAEGHSQREVGEAAGLSQQRIGQLANDEGNQR